MLSVCAVAVVSMPPRSFPRVQCSNSNRTRPRRSESVAGKLGNAKCKGLRVDDFLSASIVASEVRRVWTIVMMQKARDDVREREREKSGITADESDENRR